MLARAAAGRYAIGAFNVSEFLTLKAVVLAAKKLRAPVIIETSPGETAFLGPPVCAALLHAMARFHKVPIFGNLDHATTLADLRTGIAAGYAMLHFDGSLLTERENVQKTRKAVLLAHARGSMVEGERDHITGSSKRHRRRSRAEQAKGRYTDPAAARRFVQETGVDIFASFVGNVHGIFADREQLDMPLLKRIRAAVPASCFLSLHGGSGIRDTDVRAAIRAGITKVNVNTELRIALLDALRRALRTTREAAPYKLFPPVLAAVQRVAEQKIRLFGSAGKA